MNAPALELCLALTQAQSRTALAVDEALGAWHGLAWRDLVLLLALQRAPGGAQSLAQAAAGLALAPSALMRMTLPLEKTGWVERRGGRLSLRPAGDRLAREAAASADLAARGLLEAVPAEDRQRLRELLAALTPDAAAPVAGQVPEEAR